MMTVPFVCVGRGCRVDLHGPLIRDGQQVVDWRIDHVSDPPWYAYVNPAEQDANGALSTSEQWRFIRMAERMHAEYPPRCYRPHGHEGDCGEPLDQTEAEDAILHGSHGPHPEPTGVMYA